MYDTDLCTTSRYRILTPLTSIYFTVDSRYCGLSCFTTDEFYDAIKEPKDLINNMKNFDGGWLKINKAINLDTGKYL